MSEHNATLDTIYENWKKYQDKLKEALAPLTAEQLALRSAANERSIGELAMHIVQVRAGWFTYTLTEKYEGIQSLEEWDKPGAAPRTAAQLVTGLDLTWQMMADALARWNSDDMAKEFPDEDDGVVYNVSRQWVIWHLIEHDLHHGGEVSLTLGMHGLKALGI